MTSASLKYDSHGDTTTLANETLTYDDNGRNLSTTTTGSLASTVTYTRDVAGSIIGMTTTGATPSSVRYSSGAGLQFTLNSTLTALNETTMSLPGGVTVSIRSSSQVWSFPDLHGDDVVTTDGAGIRASSTLAVFDPFGDPIDPATGLIGTIAANSQDLGNTTTPGASYGWEGSHGKQDQHTGDIATIEMGARQYVPTLGRFLSTDPVAGGNANDYNYPNDPVNGSDLSGAMANCMAIDVISCTHGVVARIEKSIAKGTQKYESKPHWYFAGTFRSDVDGNLTVSLQGSQKVSFDVTNLGANFLLVHVDPNMGDNVPSHNVGPLWPTAPVSSPIFVDSDRECVPNTTCFKFSFTGSNAYSIENGEGTKLDKVPGLDQLPGIANPGVEIDTLPFEVTAYQYGTR